jgi:hypothetical protein
MIRILAAEAIFSLVVLALQSVPRGAGWASLAGFAMVVAALPVLLAAAGQHRASPSRAGNRLLVWGCIAFSLAQLLFAIVRLLKPKVIDIGQTTLAAIRAVAHGENPYVVPIDLLAGGIPDAASFHGFKYMPMMIVDYAPLCLVLGIGGIVATNIALQAGTAAAIRSIAAESAGRPAGLAAAALYLSVPFVAHQTFTRGVTALAAVLPLLLALRWADRRPALAGLMAGLSISTKLVPGLAVLPCALPAPGGRVRFAVGVLLGLLPIVPFAAQAPEAFVANVLLFNTTRPIDDTSWLLGLPDIVVMMTRAAILALLLAITARVWRRPPSLDQRCALAALVSMAVLAVGPAMHHNYYLWFIPFLAILAGRAATGVQAPADRPATTQQLARGAPAGAGP